MKKFFIYVLFIIVPGIQLFGQSFSRLNNYWDNTYSINPASINDEYLGTVSIATRKQWVNFPGSPTTLYAMGTIYFEDYYTQIGMKVLAEKKGYTMNTEIDLSYTYLLLLDNDWALNMALASTFQNLSYDISKITFPAFENPEIYDRLLVNNNVNATVGFELNYFTYKIGLASHNLISLFDNTNDLHPNTNILYAKYRQKSADYINLGIGVSAFQQNNVVQGEFLLNAYFKKTMSTEKLELGAIYRTWREVGLIFAIDWGRFKMSYSCDYNFGQVYRYSFGSHELMLTYHFNEARKCINCGWY